MISRLLTAHAGYVTALFLAFSLAGCGGGGASPMDSSASSVRGTAVTGQAIDGAATLRDVNGETRTSAISQPGGEFNFDVTGLKPPYFLKAEDNAGGIKLYSVATDIGNFNVNPLTNLAVIAAAKDIDPLTQSPDAPFNGPEKFAGLTADQLATAVDRVMSRLSQEFQDELVASDANNVSPLTDPLKIGVGLDSVLDKFEISLDAATGEIRERNNASNAITMLGTVDVLGASPAANCEQATGMIDIVAPPAGTLIVAAIPACKTYDAANYAGGNGVVYIGFLDGDTPDVLSGTLSYSGTSQGARNVGSYTIVPGGLTSSSYTISYIESTLTISPYKLPSIIKLPVSRVYDSGTLEAPAGSTATVGLFSGETVTLAVPAAIDTTTNVYAPNLPADPATIATAASPITGTATGTTATVSNTNISSYPSPINVTQGTISANTNATYFPVDLTFTATLIPTGSAATADYSGTFPTFPVANIPNYSGTTIVSSGYVLSNYAITTTASALPTAPNDARTIFISGAITANYSATYNANLSTLTVSATPISLPVVNVVAPN